MKIDLNYFKKKLEEEKHKLEEELRTTSIRNPKDERDYQATYPEKNGPEKMEADDLDVAESMEEYQERYDLNDVLEKRLNNVKDALKAIEDNTYGWCNVGGTPHEIEEERLNANPAATTCINHIE
jgi:RNA polymerase-binding transcription factor DksA